MNKQSNYLAYRGRGDVFWGFHPQNTSPRYLWAEQLPNKNGSNNGDLKNAQLARKTRRLMAINGLDFICDLCPVFPGLQHPQPRHARLFWQPDFFGGLPGLYGAPV